MRESNKVALTLVVSKMGILPQSDHNCNATLSKSKSAFHLLELAGLEELVLTSVNGKQKTSSRVYARGNCALRHAHKGKQTWRCRIIMCSVFGSCCGALKPM